MEEKKQATQIGEKLLEKGMQTFKVNEKTLKSHPRYLKFMRDHGLNAREDLLVSLGFGKILFKDLFNFVTQEKDTKPSGVQAGSKPKNVKEKQGSLISVQGASNIMVNFAKCCKPIYGDAIQGHISLKKGIVIHRSSCFMLGSISSERWIDVDWEKEAGKDTGYDMSIKVLCIDQPGTLNKLSEAFIYFGLDISDLNIEKKQDGKAIVQFSTQVQNVNQAQNLLTRIRKLQGVIQASRESSDPRKSNQGPEI